MASYNRFVASRTKSEIARTVAQNFIKAYGQKKFVRLVEMLKSNEPGPKIAYEFDVSRQRVHQWKEQLGVETRTFTLDPEVHKLLGVTSHSRKLV